MPTTAPNTAPSRTPTAGSMSNLFYLNVFPEDAAPDGLCVSQRDADLGCERRQRWSMVPVAVAHGACRFGRDASVAIFGAHGRPQFFGHVAGVVEFGPEE